MKAKDFSLHIAIDLGSESTKVAYAYQDAAGKVVSGKMECDDKPFPGIVSYCKESGKWLIGAKVESDPDFAYDTIVRIKDMISMLIPTKKGSKHIDNSKHYTEGKHFPIFYFPQKVKADADFSKCIENGQTFESRLTPRQLAQAYFTGLYEECILPQAKEIMSKNPQLKDMRFVSVYPSKANKAFIKELEELIKGASKSKQVTSLSAPKAVAIGAYQHGVIPNNTDALIVDLGERDISVTKVHLGKFGEDISINVDGFDGHNPPEELGGKDFDEALAELISIKAQDREILGSGLPSSTDETGTYRQQYFLLRNIKEIKTCFSIPDEEYNLVFSKGVPIQLQRDIAVELSVTKEEFIRTLFDQPGSIGERIAEYLKTELERPADKNVKTVVLSGGSAASLHLCEYLSENVKSKQKIKYTLFDTEGENDTSEHAAALGAAIITPANIVLKLHCALTYGTWVDYRPNASTYKKRFKVLINCGDVIPQEGCIPRLPLHTTRPCVDGDELFSYPHPIDAKECFIVGEPGSAERAAAIKMGLKVVSGQSGSGRIYFVRKDKNGKYVNFENPQKKNFHFFEGFKIDADGHAHPFVENDKERNLENPEFLDIIVRCDGLDDFDVTGD